jgi:hypothetical protein
MENYRSSELTVAVLTCVECDVPWLEPSERWRVYLTEDALPEPVAYCERCATREFGSARARFRPLAD